MIVGAGQSETWKVTLRSDEVSMYGLEAEFLLPGDIPYLLLAFKD